MSDILFSTIIFGFLLTSYLSLSLGNQKLFQNLLTIKQKEVSSIEAIFFMKNILQNYFYDRTSTTSAEVIDIDNFTKKIKSGDFFTFVTNPAEAVGSSNCLLTEKDSWQSFKTIPGPDLGLGNQATALFARGSYIYLTANNATPRDPKADPNDLFIIDSTNLSIVSKLDTGPGLAAIALAGRYAYVGNTSINAQLQIVDISDPLAPRLVKNFKLPGNYTDGTTIANSLFYHEGKIFLGTAKSQIEELHIIDVGDPLNPKEVGKWEVNAAVNAMYVSDYYLYLTSPNSEELVILDISDPSNIQKVGGFDAPGGSGNGKSLSKDRNTLFLGRTVGKDELFALNIANPSFIISSGSKAIADSLNSILVVGEKVFIGTNNSFQVLEESTLSNLVTIGLSAKITGMSCSGSTIFLSLLQTSGLLAVAPMR